MADVNPQIQRSFSDDGGKTFSNTTSRSLGVRGDYKARQIWRREGDAPRHRMYRFVHDSPTAFAALDLRIDIT